MKKLLTIFFILIVTLSCNDSRLSTGNIDSLSLIRAEIGIFQSLQDKQDNQIQVDLTDEEGRLIKNDSIKIYVNGEQASYTIRKGLYYTSTVYYSTVNAAPQNNRFTVEIALPGKQKTFLAEIAALELVHTPDITCPEKSDLDKDVVLAWKALSGVNHLEISRSVKLKKKDEANIVYYEEEASDTVSIAATGTYTIPKATFDNAEKQVSILSFKFIAANKGNVSTQLAKGSSIGICGYIERRTSFE